MTVLGLLLMLSACLVGPRRGRLVPAGRPDDPPAGGDGGGQRHARQLLRRRPIPRRRPRRRPRRGTSPREGAHLLDIGGESSRPGADPVPEDEETPPGPAGRRGPRRRRSTCRSRSTRPSPRSPAGRSRPAPRSSTTSGGLLDDGLARVVAETGAAVVLMHMRGRPRRRCRPTLGMMTWSSEVYDALARRVERAEAFGIDRARIAVDPGIGFGKTGGPQPRIAAPTSAASPGSAVPCSSAPRGSGSSAT